MNNLITHTWCVLLMCSVAGNHPTVVLNPGKYGMQAITPLWY